MSEDKNTICPSCKAPLDQSSTYRKYYAINNNSRRAIWKDISCSLINLRQPGTSSSSSCQISFSINVLLKRSSCENPTCALQEISLWTETSHLQARTDNARGRTKVRRPESPCGASTAVWFYDGSIYGCTAQTILISAKHSLIRAATVPSVHVIICRVQASWDKQAR